MAARDVPVGCLFKWRGEFFVRTKGPNLNYMDVGRIPCRRLHSDTNLCNWSCQYIPTFLEVTLLEHENSNV